MVIILIMFNLIFISFIIAFVCLAFLLLIKVWENKTNKIIISKRFLNKSDVVLKRGIVWFFDYYVRVLSKVTGLSEFYRKIKSELGLFLIEKKNQIGAKVIRALNINNVKDIEKNKGSVSLFLRSISDDKENKHSELHN